MWPNPQFPMQLVAFTEKAIMENFNSTVFLRISLLTHSLCEKCPNVEFFFWPVFSCIRTEYEDLRSEVFSPNTGKDGPETFHAVISGQYSYFPEHFIFWGLGVWNGNSGHKFINYFWPMFQFHISWKHQKTKGVLVFSERIKWEHWPGMG